MKQLRNENGFASVVGLFLLLVVLAGAGVYVSQQRSAQNTASSSASMEQSRSTQPEAALAPVEKGNADASAIVAGDQAAANENIDASDVSDGDAQ